MKPRIDSQQQGRQNMNLDKAGNNLEEFKTRVHKRWHQLSDEQLERISGRRDRLSQELARTYGISPADADAEIDDFEAGTASIAGAGSGRGPTESARELGTGNDQGGTRNSDKHRFH